MKRILEWILASAAAILCIGGALSIWVTQAADNPPGVSLWPMPAIVLLEIVILGLVGFFGIVFEPRPSTPGWGWLVWMACGGLLGLAILGYIGLSVIFLLAVPALMFLVAAILSDLRRKRKLSIDFGILALSVVVNFGLFYLIAVIK